MSFLCEHWEALSSLLLSVVAIIIAIYSSYKTSTDATRQIESIKDLSQQTIDNTTREIDSIKQLAKLQIEALSVELDMEMMKYQALAEKSDTEWKAKSNGSFRHYQSIADMMNKDFEYEAPLRELRYHAHYIQSLREISKRLESLKSNLN